MQYSQQQLGLMNNDTAIKLLWAGIICYVLGFFLPQIDFLGGVDSLLVWDVLTIFGIMIMLASIVLTYIAITKAKLFASVKKFGITSSVIMLIPIGAISSQLNDLNTISENAFGVELFEYGAGYYLLWIGVILSTIGSFKAQSILQYKGYPVDQQPQFRQQFQQSQYQQPVQYQQPQYSQPQNQNQQPMQPPSYISPEPKSVNQPVHNKLDEYPKTAQQSTQQGKFCGNCGQRNDSEAKFCVNCGQTMNEF